MPPGFVMRNEKAVLKPDALSVTVLKTLPDLAAIAGTRRITMPSLLLTAAADPLSVRPVVFEKSANDTVVARAGRAVRAHRASTAAAMGRSVPTALRANQCAKRSWRRRGMGSSWSVHDRGRCRSLVTTEVQ